MEQKIQTIFTTVGVATTLRDGQSGVPTQAEAIDCSLLQNVHPGSEAHPASYSMGTEVVSRGLSDRNVMLTTHFRLASKLRMSVTIYNSTLLVCRSGLQRGNILFTSFELSA